MTTHDHMSDDRHYEENDRHDFEEDVLVPAKTAPSNDDGLWPAERRLYDIFPREAQYAGTTARRSKKSCGSGGGMM